MIGCWGWEQVEAWAFTEMEKKRPQPNVVTFIGVLTTCNQETLVNKAWWFFGRMSRVSWILLAIEHNGCMVDLLACFGWVKWAAILIRLMPMEPDGSIWGPLLNGYLMTGHVELGKMVGKLLIQLESKRSERSILLSNITQSVARKKWLGWGKWWRKEMLSPSEFHWDKRWSP